MSKRVYISADYSSEDGDLEVVETLTAWGSDSLHTVDFIDMSQVFSGSISEDEDCRPCDLKEEFNKQINASSAVIIVIGDKTATRTAGSKCARAGNEQKKCSCTPYKQNANGAKSCKVSITITPGKDEDVGNINSYSYLRHEFEQAKRRNKKIIVVYNSLTKQSNWLPNYMKDYESDAQPFWIKNSYEQEVGNYKYIKEALGYV